MRKKPKRLPRTVSWLPPHEKPSVNPKNGHHKLRDSESRIYLLKRWEGENTLYAYEYNTCCDCTLKHLNTFEVYRETKTGRYALCIRTWRIGKRGKSDG